MRCLYLFCGQSEDGPILVSMSRSKGHKMLCNVQDS